MNPNMLTVDEALAMLTAHARPLREVEMSDTFVAHGRVLATDLVSPISVPSLDTSMMDGYALRVADVAAAGTRSSPAAQRAFSPARRCPRVPTLS